MNPPERTSAMRRFVVPLLAVVLFGSLLGVPSAAAQAQVPEPLPEPLEIGDQAVGGGGDSERPKVVSLEVVSSPADGWRSAYGEGESVQFGVTFSEPVAVQGEPRLRIQLGGAGRWAPYVRSAAGDTRLVFAYVVKALDVDLDGVSVKQNALKRRGATIADAAGNAARLTHPALPDQSAHAVAGTPQGAAPSDPNEDSYRGGSGDTEVEDLLGEPSDTDD
ncbi:MAG: hypothetical protein OXB92_15795, partial [Acidimicrobiaceae bacterium]|nr:hypothetical protein [Acidimicrobiaceae bacterium]